MLEMLMLAFLKAPMNIFYWDSSTVTFFAAIMGIYEPEVSVLVFLMPFSA